MKTSPLLIAFLYLLVQGIDATIDGGGGINSNIEYDDLNFQMFDGEKHSRQVKRSTQRSIPSSHLDYEEDEEEMEERPDPSTGDWKWCLLYLTGNATILQIRREDFIKYLRINIASLISSSYDHVFFNSISYAPSILVNVSLNFKDHRHSKIVSSLNSLSRHNDTLFDLSGTHYNLTDFLPSYALTAPKSEVTPFASAADSGDSISSNGLNSPHEIEAIIYVVVGGAIALLLTASLLFTVCQCVVIPKRRRASEEQQSRVGGRRKSGVSEYSLDNYQKHQYSRNSSEQSPSRSSIRSQPKLIYSRGFSDSLLASPADTDVTAMTPSVSGHSSSFIPVESSDFGRRPHSRIESRDGGSDDDKKQRAPYLLQRDIIYHRNQDDDEDDNLTPLLFAPRKSVSKPASVIGSMDYQTVVIQDPNYHFNRPSSALSSFKPLPPPASFASPPAPPPSVLLSPTSSTTSSRSGQPPRKWSRINRPSDEEIARDVQIVFQNMGLDSGPLLPSH